MDTIKKIILWSSLLLIITACGPELTLPGSTVRVGTENALEQCRILGSTRFSLSSSGQKLKEVEMKKRLLIEARNFAARIGGNMVLPVGTIKERAQSFTIYNCAL